MGKRYREEERQAVLKLADEISAAAALEAAVGGWSEGELAAEIEVLREQLR